MRQSALGDRVSMIRNIWVRALLLVLVSALIIAGLLWFERIAIARRFADGELEVRKVKATYEITQISPKTQRIEHLVIGDPANPDLVADWAEIDVALRWMAADVVAVRAGGVRLKGRYADNRFAFGEVDKLLPKPSGEPFALPDMNVALSNSRIDLATPYSAISAVINGKGNLADGFTSKVVSTATSARLGSCTVTGAAGNNELMVRQRKFLIGGTFRLGEVRCGGAVASDLLLSPELTIPENFGGWEGNLFAQAGDVKAAGYHARAGTFRGKPLTYAVSGSGSFKGDAGQTSGSLSLLTNALSGPMLADGAFSLRSGFVASPQKGSFGLSQGEISSPRFVIAPSALAPLQRIPAQAVGTPLESLGRGLGAALVDATLVNSGSASFDANYAAGRGTVIAKNLTINGPNGFAVKARPRDALVVNLPSGKFVADGLLSVTGSEALPRGTISIAANQHGARGEARLLPLATSDTRLALAPIAFAYEGARWSLASSARFDGPIAGGRVSGLQLPLSLKNGALATSCLPVSFDQLALRGITLARTHVGLCLSGDRVALGPTNLTASLGSTPLTLSAAQSSFGLRKQDFVLSDVTAKLGGGTSASLIRAARFNGVVAGSGASGRFAQAEATIGTVPLLLSEIGGTWRFGSDVLTLGGALRVADRDRVPRFLPLVSNDVVLRLANQKISANGTLQTPKGDISLARVTLRHDLRAEVGQADLDVAGITFGQTLQPEALTPITLGKVANVFGAVAGAGTIKWTRAGVTSTGGFRTDALNFAAAFGPVTGLKGAISLSDLLGLETPAGQRVTIGAINPGILVQDGVVSYRLLPGLKVQIEGGRWPFSGGSLILEPTTLDLSESAVRNLTFRVEGLDAAKFINQLEFENIAATGTFDGVLPMVFDKNGGRIVGGRLVARSGGTLSYVGEVSKENLGFMGQFAFDALKSMKYDRLAIDLGGAIDGDIVTQVSFAGVNQLPIAPQRTRFPIPIQGIDNIRFIFNVTITAPFRQLFETTRSLQDPSRLIERIVPQLQPPASKPSVQP
jgi:translocation and assembly module TamB